MSNGAKELAERRAKRDLLLAYIVDSLKSEEETRAGNQRTVYGQASFVAGWLEAAPPKVRDAILADDAVFLTAEEAERLRRIEAAARDVAPAWDRAVSGAVKGGYGPINAEFGDVADMVKVLRAALTDPEPSHD